MIKLSGSDRASCLWALVVLLAIPVSAELLARVGLGLGTPPLSRPDPLMEYQFVPNQQVERFGNRISINRYGMRSVDFPPDRPHGQRRVLVFGDSVLFGGSILDQKLIATAILEARLGPDALVGNVSAGSWGPGNWLGWIRRYGLLEATDVLILSSSHDAFDHPTWTALNPLTHPQSNPTYALVELWNRYLQPYLHTPSTATPPRAPAARSQASLTRSLNDLEQVILRARTAGARVAAVQFWELHELQSGRMRPGYLAQSRLLERMGVPRFDAGPAMARCASNKGILPKKLFVDNIHPFTPVGQRCLAKVLAGALQY